MSTLRKSTRAMGSTRAAGSTRAMGSFRNHKMWTDRELLLFHASHDRDGDGSISRHEFLEMLTSMQLLQPIVVRPALAAAPAEGVRVVAEGGEEEEEEEEDNLENHAKACRVFDSIDLDESGALSASEFIEAYHRYLREDPAGFSVADEASAAPPAADRDSFSFSKVTITAVKWWPGAPARGAQAKTVSYMTYATEPRKEPPALAQLSDFLAAAAGEAEAAPAGAPTVWLDVVGPQHQATLEWLRRLGLECATKQAFREEGVWHRGALGRPAWGAPPPPPPPPPHADGPSAPPPPPPPTPARAWAGALLPALWLANTPFRAGSARALGCCKWRAAPPVPQAEAVARARRSLHWLCCGSREGTVLVAPHEGEAAASSAHAVEDADAALAAFWARYVARFSKGERNVASEGAGAGGAGAGAGGAGGSGAVSARELRLRKGRDEAEGLIEAMVRGGEFHVVSQAHLRARAPHFVRHLVGVFTVAAGGAAAAGVAAAGVEGSGASATGAAPAPAPALLLTVRPCDEWGMVSCVLEGFRARVQGRAGYLAARSGGGRAGGREGREESLMRALDAPLLASAIADSLGVRFNDLTFRVLEHWAAVLRVCVHEQPSSLHQRHLTHLGELAARVHEYAAKLVLSQAQLTGGSGSGSGSGSGGGTGGSADKGAGSSGKRDFFDTFSRRAAHLEARALRLVQRVRDLQDQYKTRLDEDRNWMVTALTLFTAGTWPLSFLTGYFGMNFQNMAELGPGTAEGVQDFSNAPIPGVAGVRVFWLFFGLFLLAVMFLFQRMRFFANLW